MSVADPREQTIAAYQEYAQAYAAARTGVPDQIHRDIVEFSGRVGPGGQVLEIGSGPGLDALALEESGLSVRRTDITPAFVDLLRAQGHDADVLDPLSDDLGGPYDGVWASAVLLHVERADLPVLLTRVRAAVRDDGVLYLSVKEGDGEVWSTHGSVATPRHFVLWREEPLREVLDASGWEVERLAHTQGSRDPFLDVFARAVPR